jgi:hypothetical protein
MKTAIEAQTIVSKMVVTIKPVLLPPLCCTDADATGIGVVVERVVWVEGVGEIWFGSKVVVVMFGVTEKY